jgi:hypothetical protein
MSDIVDRLKVRGKAAGERLNHTWRRLHVERIEAANEIVRLRTALRQYGDRNRMAWAPPDLQATIDAAMSEPLTAADPRPSPADHPLPPA